MMVSAGSSRARNDAPRATLVLCTLVALALGLATLGSGYDYDESLQMATIEEGVGPADMTRLHLWRFSGGDAKSVERSVRDGWLPWWYPSSGSAGVNFFRPLAAALAVGEVHLFGRNPPLQHAHSVLWFSLVVAAVYLVYWVLLGTAQSRLPLWVFVLSGVHWEAVAPICARHILVATLLSALGLVFHVRWRSGASRGGLALSLLFFALAMLAGETALQMIAYVLCVELARDTTWLSRLVGAAPLIVLTAVYIAAYRAAGFGAASSGYLTPAWDMAFLREGAERYIRALQQQLLTLGDRDLLSQIEAGPAGFLGIVSLVCVLALITQATLRAPEAQRAPLLALYAAGFLSLVPAMLAQPGPRLLMVPSIGFSAAIARVIEHGWSRARHWPRLRSGTAFVFGAALIALVHIALSPAAFVNGALGFARRNRSNSAEVWQMTNTALEVPSRAVVLWAPPDLNFIWMRALSLSRKFFVLSSTISAPRLTRTAADELVLDAGDGGWCPPPERWPDSLCVVEQGRVVALPDVTLEVLDQAGHGPGRIAVRWKVPPTATSWQFVTRHEGQFIPVHLPQIGASMSL